jgi:hypothetical protein
MKCGDEHRFWHSSLRNYFIVAILLDPLSVSRVRISFVALYSQTPPVCAIGARIGNGYGLDRRGVGVRVPVGASHFCPLHVAQTSSGVHPVPVKYIPGLFPPGEGVKGLRCKAGHSLQPVPTSRKRVSEHPLPHTSSWRIA